MKIRIKSAKNWHKRPVLSSMKMMGQFLLDRLIPFHCPLCDRVMQSRGLCQSCWPKLHFIPRPICQSCGRPLVAASYIKKCASCLSAPSPLITHRRASLSYDEASKAILLPFKHADRLDYLPLITDIMMADFLQMTQHHPLIIPIPLHRYRMVYRRFNQSAEIARLLCHKTKQTEYLRTNLLRRIKHTQPMGCHGPHKRAQIINKAFALSQDAQDSVKGQAVLLIDDVMTTGATMNEAAKCLKQAGASQIDCLCLCRVL
ncbi:MAG: double zinc ribbon domain-containing protein [Candidatus Puniceispirillaceae bacterium]